MSFSSDIKQELNKANSLANKENVKFELIGYLISGNVDVVKGKNVKFSTESDYNINRFSKLLSNLGINHDIDVNGKSFNIVTKSFDLTQLGYLEISDGRIYLKQNIYDIKLDDKIKAIIRGVFLGAGSINNPENSYHLEIIVSNEKNLKILEKMLKNFDINIKELIIKNFPV